MENSISMHTSVLILSKTHDAVLLSIIHCQVTKCLLKVTIALACNARQFYILTIPIY